MELVDFLKTVGAFLAGILVKEIVSVVIKDTPIGNGFREWVKVFFSKAVLSMAVDLVMLVITIVALVYFSQKAGAVSGLDVIMIVLVFLGLITYLFSFLFKLFRYQARVSDKAKIETEK